MIADASQLIHRHRPQASPRSGVRARAVRALVIPAFLGTLLATAAGAERATRAAPEVRYLDAKPLAELIGAEARPVVADGPIRLPVLGRGPDVAAVYAREHGLFAAQGVEVELVPGNDFVAQVEATLAGESPYLRGTVGMIQAAAEVFARAGVELVVVDRLAPAGGDALVTRPGVASPSGLAGKKVALQRHGPHVVWLHQLLRRAGVPAEAVEPRWLAEPTLPATDPADGGIVDAASAFLADDSIDAVLVTAPDALALTSGGEVGTGAAGSVRGARIVATTAGDASPAMTEVYAVRGDWLADHDGKAASVARALAAARVELATEPARDAAFLGRAGEVLFGSPYATADVAALIAGGELVDASAGEAFFVRDLPRLADQAREALAAFGLGRITAEPGIPERYRKAPVRRADTPSSAQPEDGRLASAALTTKDDPAGKDAPPSRLPASVGDSAEKPPAEPTRVAAKDETAPTDDPDVTTRPAPAPSRGDAVATIRFAPDQATFAAERHAASFERILDALRRQPGTRVVIEGHVDGRRLAAAEATPLERHLLAQQARNLGLRRAQAVRAALLVYCAERDAATDASRFVAVGRGASGDGDTPGPAVVIRIETPAAAARSPENAP